MRDGIILKLLVLWLKLILSLELGAGNLNHLKFEKDFKNYDVIEPKEFLIKASDPIDIKKIDNIYKSIDDLPKGKVYDKLKR